MFVFQPIEALLNAARAIQAKAPAALHGTNEFVALEKALAEIADAHRESEECRAAIHEAGNLYASDDIQIDAKPAVSIADDATWVSAWLRVEHRQ